jgi:hypothetical protein
MQQNITASKNKNPEDVVGNSSLEGAHVEDDFVKLDLAVEHSVFYAKGDILEGPYSGLRDASKEIDKFSGPVSATVGDIPGLGTVDLLYRSDKPVTATFYLVAGGMRGELTNPYLDDQWSLEIRGSGPHSVDAKGLAELDKVRRFKEFFFGKDVRIELKSCSIALCCHISPDLSDTASTADTYSDFIYGRITRAKRYPDLPRVPDSQKKLFSSYRFGDLRADRRVSISVSGGKHPSHSAMVAHVEGSAHYREDREIICLQLIFRGSFIRHIAKVTPGDSSDLNLPDLLWNLVRATLGDETLPHSFFRVATLESQGLPDSLRPNSAAWERVRRAFLEGVAASGQVAKEGRS